MFDTHCDYATGYSSKERGLMLYNEDKDKWDVISLFAALQHSGLFHDNGELKDLGGLDADGQERDARDAQQDFLTRETANGQRVSVSRFGDIHPSYFGRGMLDNLGATVVDAVFKGDMSRRNRLRSELEKLRQDAVDRGGVLNFTDLEASKETGIKFLVNRLRAIFGNDNYFVGGQGALQRIAQNFIGFGAVPIKGNAGGRAPTDPQSRNVISSTFRTLGFAAATDDAKKAVNAIFDNEALSVDERLDNAHELFMSWVDHEDNLLLDKVNDQHELNTWFTTVRSQYQDHMDKLGGGAKASGLSWAAPHRPDMEYVHESIVGHIKPMGYEDFPSSIHSMPLFIQAKIAHALQKESGGGANMQAAAGQGYNDDMDDIYGGGAYGIGQAQHFDDPAQQGIGKDASVTMPDTLASDLIGTMETPTDRFRSIEVHINNLGTGSSDVLTRICASVFLGARVTRQRFEAMINHNILFPMNFLILRPHATYR